MKHLILILTLVATLTHSAVSAQQGARIDIAKVGPQVGQQVPNFRLTEQAGKAWTLQSIMGPNGAMLVFSRSVDWCPYCKTQMVELQGRLAELRAQGLGLAVITYDSPAIMADFAKRRGITFPLLSDVGSPTIKAYGVLNTTVAQNTSNYGIPFPGTLILDRRGRVTARFFEEAFQERNTVSTIMLALGKGKAPVSASRVQTEHLDITTYASDDVVAPGTLFSLVQALGLSAAADKRDAITKLQSLTVTGSLEYQACDDKVCYPPRTVPVSYTLKVKGLDAQRATVTP